MFTDFVDECGASKGAASSMIADEVKVDGHVGKAEAAVSA
jgi:hypothetical protein